MHSAGVSGADMTVNAGADLTGAELAVNPTQYRSSMAKTSACEFDGFRFQLGESIQ